MANDLKAYFLYQLDMIFKKFVLYKYSYWICDVGLQENGKDVNTYLRKNMLMERPVLRWRFYSNPDGIQLNQK